MRISDWSSDVCSSDLVVAVDRGNDHVRQLQGGDGARQVFGFAGIQGIGAAMAHIAERAAAGALDRKSGVEGKRVAVRVDLGGSRSIKKKRRELHQSYENY